MEFIDKTLCEKGLFFPFAQDGMYNESNSAFDTTRDINQI